MGDLTNWSDAADLATKLGEVVRNNDGWVTNESTLLKPDFLLKHSADIQRLIQPVKKLLDDQFAKESQVIDGKLKTQSRDLLPSKVAMTPKEAAAKLKERGVVQRNPEWTAFVNKKGAEGRTKKQAIEDAKAAGIPRS